MNLKEVCGFKSFRENVSVEFTGGMNCVVGKIYGFLMPSQTRPHLFSALWLAGENGSGKTNTLDGNFLTYSMHGSINMTPSTIGRVYDI